MRSKHTLSAQIITPRLVERFNKHVLRLGNDDCWEWQGYRLPEKGKYLTTSHYGRVSIFDPIRGKFISEYSHRIAWLIAAGHDIPAGMVIRHTCDNPPCCNPVHLALGTFVANAKDRDAKGRGHFVSSSDYDKNPEIPQLYLQGWTIKQLEDEFGVPGKTIHYRMKRDGIPIRRRGTPGFRDQTKT
jgi:hypothetical protein